MEDKQLPFIILIGLLCLAIVAITVVCLMLAKRYDSYEQEVDDRAQLEYIRSLKKHKEEKHNNEV